MISLTISVACAIASWEVALTARKRQDSFMQAMENRLASTIKMLRSLKSLRMLGLDNLMSDDIQNTRVREVDLIKHYSIMTIYATGIGSESHLPIPIVKLILISQRS